MKGVLRQDSHYTVSEEPFMKQLSDRMNIETANFGRFGSTVTTGNKIVSRHLEEISAYKYTLLEFGGNDCDFNWQAIAENPDQDHKPNTELPTFALSYKEMIDKVKFAGSKPVLLSLPPISSKKYFGYLSGLVGQKGSSNILKWLNGSEETIGNWHELYNLEIFKLGLSLKVPVVDISSAFLTSLSVDKYLCEDGIHPNSSGQNLIADTLCAYFSA